MLRSVALCVLALTASAAHAGDRKLHPVSDRDAEFFEKQVRPILVEHCLSCHGSRKQMSGLRLDSRAALLQGGDNGPVVRPGDPEQSPLIHAIRHQGERKMPPKTKLKPAQVAALTHWIKTGVPWPKSAPLATKADVWKRHWAFQPVKKPAPPAVQQSDWPQTPVDRFVLARLEAKGLKPSPQADRHILLRRVTFDLIGLPPTPAEIAAFENDTAPDAFARVIDRLLASPHYGERWGRHWLDVARYADTKGYVFFEEAEFPWAWTYRDYVLRAFNEDLPYNRFLVEQLAADRLAPSPLPLSPPEGRGVGVRGADKRPLTALGFLTLGGRFMSNVHDVLDDRIDVVTRGLLGLTVTCARCHDHKFDPIPTKDYYSLYGVFASSVEPTVPPLFAEPPHTAAYEKFDKEMKAREKKLTDFVRAKHDEVTAAARKRAAEYLLAVHAMRNQPRHRSVHADCRWQRSQSDHDRPLAAYLRRTQKNNSAVFALWHALAALPQKDFAARAAAVVQTFASEGRERPINALVLKAFAGTPPRTLKEAAGRYGDLLNAIEKKWPASLTHSAAEEELRQVFHGPGAATNVPRSLFGELALLPDRPSQAQLQALRKQVEQWRANGPGAPPRAMVLVDVKTPVEPRVFRRGSPNNLGEAVPRRFLQVLSGKERQPFRDGSGRLELAHAIADRNNPLTARVLVNRVWMHHFGAGLVRTPSDFGLRSEPPSHPELLDYLATAFMDCGWSLKKLHRSVLLSAAYQQQSGDRPECRGVDAENTLLWKANRRRLDYESLRDALLAVSGRIDRTLGGPSVRDLLSGSGNRRTLYGHLDRLNVPGLMRTFDFPSPDATSPQRLDTTVPQQALFLMNNPFALDCARRLLQRPDMVGGKEVSGKVDKIYRLLFGRGPSAEEGKLAEAFLGAGAGAAWEQYVQALLLTNEFVFLD